MNSTIPVTAVIDTVRPLTTDTSLFTLTTASHDSSVATFSPGQFVELSLPGIGEIPISYCGYPSTDGSIELCIRHGGHVTSPLKTKIKGDRVGLRGPFGRGFPMAAFSGQDLLLIAGGVGMAPLRSLLLALLKQRQKWGDITVLYGAREVATLLFMDELLHLKEHGEIELLMAADHPGTTLPSNCRIALLPALLEQITVEPLRTCAALCGPPAVYPPLISTLQMLGLGSDRIYLSLERHMKCGIGRCGHCAVGTRLCCTDGPVFSCAELSGIEGAFG